MKALGLSELRELLESAAFVGWWQDLVRAEARLRDAGARHEDLVGQSRTMQLRGELAAQAADEAFSRAGEVERQAAQVEADAQAHENRALELLGSFEELRFQVSDLWYRLGGAERILEERREAALAGRGRSRKGQGEQLLRQAEKQRAGIEATYQRESARKQGLWEEVEAAWGRSFELSLVGAERAAAAKRLRRDAERLFQESQARRERAQGLAREAEAALRERDEAVERREALLAQARSRFACVPGRGFLYWRRPGDRAVAWAVPLRDDAEGYNIEAKALAVYTADRRRGVAFLEPAREGPEATGEEGDRRLESWLLGPRKGRSGAGAGP